MEQEATKLMQFIREVAKGQENALDIQNLVTAGGEKRTVIALQNRELQPEQPKEPILAKSPRRAHIFHDVQTFKSYIKKVKTDNTVILANVESRSISAIVDDLTKEGGCEIVALVPPIHPLFAPWNSILDETMPVLQFAEFAMMHRRAVKKPEGRELAMVLSQIKASTRIEVAQGKGAKSLNGIMVETLIQGQKGTDLVEIPETISIRVPLFLGTDPKDIEIDLLISGDRENRIFVKAISGDVLQAQVEAFEDMVRELADLEGLVAGLGAPGYQSWETLE